MKKKGWIDITRGFFRKIYLVYFRFPISDFLVCVLPVFFQEARYVVFPAPSVLFYQNNIHTLQIWAEILSFLNVTWFFEGVVMSLQSKILNYIAHWPPVILHQASCEWALSYTPTIIFLKHITVRYELCSAITKVRSFMVVHNPIRALWFIFLKNSSCWGVNWLYAAFWFVTINTSVIFLHDLFQPILFD